MRLRHSSKEKRVQALIRTLRSQGITDERVLEAMASVPRERFVPDEFADRAWDNHALPIDFGQTISQPYVVAAMTEALHLDGSETVLEIGTGSGYQAAILSMLAREVISIERIAPLAEQARALLADLGYDNVTVVTGDGSEGYEPRAPYDAIIVTAGAPTIPPSLMTQLSPDGGRLVIPIGPERAQHLVVVERSGRNYVETSIGPVAFVPLIGSEGWPGHGTPEDDSQMPN